MLTIFSCLITLKNAECSGNVRKCGIKNKAAIDLQRKSNVKRNSCLGLYCVKLFEGRAVLGNMYVLCVYATT